MKKMEKLLQKRDKMILKGEVIPATFDPVFKSLMMNCQEYLSFGIIKDVRSDAFCHLIIQNSELPISRVIEKRKVTDVIVRVENMVINLEMNSQYYHGLFEKNEAYLRKIGSEMFVQGDDYSTIKKIIQINFDNFKVYDERIIIIRFQIADTERGIIELDSYEKYHVCLVNLKNKYYNGENLSFLEKALLLLIADNMEMLEKLSKGEKVLMEAKKEIEKLSTNLNILGLYDEEENKKLEFKMIRDYQVKLAREEGLTKGRLEGLEIGHKEGLEIGHKEGFNIGREEGISKGRKEGIIRGRKEARNEFDIKIFEIVKNMLQMDFSIESIAFATGVSKEKIESLQRN